MIKLEKVVARIERATRIGIGKKIEDNTVGFLTEFKEGTIALPFAPRVRIWKDSVGIELSPFHGSIHISAIISLVEKNAGEASSALKWLCSLADKHTVAMELDAVPIKNAGAKEGTSLTKAQLTSWYKRNGFKPSHGILVRQPNS